MSRTTLHLIYKSPIGKPLIAATVDDPRLITQVGKKAIKNAYKEAQAMHKIDDFVGQVRTEEAQRLERVLKKLIPGLDEK